MRLFGNVSRIMSIKVEKRDVGFLSIEDLFVLVKGR